jgi:hypothetical protein
VTRLPAVVAIVASALLIGCGPFKMPLADRTNVSITVDGDPGFVSFGGFRWQATLVAPSGASATVDPSGQASIAVLPGDYRLEIVAIPISDAVLCVDPQPPAPGTCTRQEGRPSAICAIPISVPPVSDVSTSVTVTGGRTCQASKD